jgi:hypothetical protein
MAVEQNSLRCGSFAWLPNKALARQPVNAGVREHHEARPMDTGRASWGNL